MDEIARRGQCSTPTNILEIEQTYFHGTDLLRTRKTIAETQMLRANLGATLWIGKSGGNTAIYHYALVGNLCFWNARTL